MRWKVNIEDKETGLVLGNQKIMVTFDPLNEQIIFTGHFKPKDKEWVVFSEEKYSMDINLAEIQELLGKTYASMKTRLDAYGNIAQGFTVIKEIAIEED